MKEFLSQNGVAYVEKMVDSDRAAAIEMVRRSGQQGVPVTIIGDEVVVGFDRPRLQTILARMKTAGGSTARGETRTGRRSLGAKVADASRYALSGGVALKGAYVGGVNPGSPAEAAGVRVGDIIVAVGGADIATADDLATILSRHPAGPIELTLRRGAHTRTVEADL